MTIGDVTVSIAMAPSHLLSSVWEEYTQTKNASYAVPLTKMAWRVKIQQNERIYFQDL